MNKNRKKNSVLETLDLDYIDIEKNVDIDIEKDIKDFHIEENIINKIELPKNFDRIVNRTLKIRKKEKHKDIRYMILDITIVLLIVSPFIGIFYPKIFIKAPTVYPIFVKINEFIQTDKITSFLGIGNKEVIEGEIDSKENTEFIQAKDVIKPTNSNGAIKLIHSLANTIIEAEYKWQCTEVTPEIISLALESVQFIKDDYDRMHLRNGLDKWVKGDFSNAVEIHNYVWEMLDGSIGKAENIDKEEIEKIKNKYF